MINGLLHIPTFSPYRKTPWQQAVLTIMRAFHGCPSDFEDWHIALYESTVKTSEDILKKSML